MRCFANTGCRSDRSGVQWSDDSDRAAMPSVNPKLLVWARETAGLTPEQAVRRLDIKKARGVEPIERLARLETGKEEPSRPLLVKMTKQYRRPLIAFYLTDPPRTGDRGLDFRTLPEGRSPAADALLDALIRDVKVKQSIVRSIIEDEEDHEALPFVGSATMENGAAPILQAVRKTLGVDLATFRAENSAEDAFTLLRRAAESIGVFVVLVSNLGSHHTTIDLETFRGFALADPIAPFVLINDQDAKTAWSFTLLHELVHIWLGETGVSGASAGAEIERFCNEIAGEFLLPSNELPNVGVNRATDLPTATQHITVFSNERNLGRSMVAYKLYRAKFINREVWRRLSDSFRDAWLRDNSARRDSRRNKQGGPSYYVVRRHRLGSALLGLVARTMSEGTLTPTKAAKVLGVTPRNVDPLLRGGTTELGSGRLTQR